MRIGVFTSNQPRHVSLLRGLARVGDVVAVQECNTVFPGQVDDFFRKSPVMQVYFSRVIRAERAVFGDVSFLPGNVRTMPIRMGDVNRLPLEALADLLSCDVVVVFGASFIKTPLVDALVGRSAINIHMGVSPQYRGSSTNFWAMYDRRPELVGATIHRLTSGLDSGPILFHAFPEPQAVDPFVYGMLSVRSAHDAVVDRLRAGTLLTNSSQVQDKSREIRYTRNADFTDAVAQEYLDRVPSPTELHDQLKARLSLREAIC
jgi:hypothetical protein